MLRPGFALLLLATSSTPTTGANDGGRCFPTDTVASLLQRTFGEIQVATSLLADGQTLVTFVSPETGTWSMLKVDPSAQACFLLMGEHWKFVRPSTLGQPT